jgi:hypothetical protein
MIELINRSVFLFYDPCKAELFTVSHLLHLLLFTYLVATTTLSVCAQ